MASRATLRRAVRALAPLRFLCHAPELSNYGQVLVFPRSPRAYLGIRGARLALAMRRVGLRARNNRLLGTIWVP